LTNELEQHKKMYKYQFCLPIEFKIQCPNKTGLILFFIPQKTAEGFDNLNNGDTISLDLENSKEIKKGNKGQVLLTLEFIKKDIKYREINIDGVKVLTYTFKTVAFKLGSFSPRWDTGDFLILKIG
jgi:hypothetical protein